MPPGLAERRSKAQFAWKETSAMPLTHFLVLILCVVLAAGLSLWLAIGAGVPLVALGFAALAASVILGWSRVSR
ncbi:MAG: hypothetical protein B7Z31_11645 [Rhodobacterales bacterium 12-65-15]|nr:MAG: hypothetical protein B7Z31_11645 [Rhodobacterales bacterium 12-65-15]